MNDPLSILLVGDYAPDPTLGSSKVFYKLREEFAAMGHACDVLFADAIGGPRARQIRQAVSPWFAGAAILRRMKTRRYHVVDAASAEGLGLAVMNAAARRRAAVVCRSNGLEHLDYERMIGDHEAGLIHKPGLKRLWYPLSRLSQVAAAARLADRLLLLNEVDRRFVLARGWQPAERIDVVPHGVSAAFLEKPGAPSQRGRGLLFCGSWTHMKGIADLVKAYARLQADGRVVPLTVLGPGLDAAAVRRDFPEHLRPRVTVVPRAPEADVIQAFREYDVLLWPSTYEGFGLVLLEAMSQGMAVVATPVGCAASLLRDGDNAIVVPTRNPEAIGAAASRLLDDEDLRRRLGAAARSTVADMSWRRTAERTIETYRLAMAHAGIAA